jgi:hypothetical protein
METIMTRNILILAVGLLLAAGIANAQGFGPGNAGGDCPFIDENGDGFNDLAPDADGDGIPNGQDPDYVKPEDGTGAQLRNGQGPGNGNGVFGEGLANAFAHMHAYKGEGPGQGQGQSHAYGPGDGTGFGTGPADGTGFGPGDGSGDCDGSGAGGAAGRRAGRR